MRADYPKKWGVHIDESDRAAVIPMARHEHTRTIAPPAALDFEAPLARQTWDAISLTGLIHPERQSSFRSARQYPLKRSES
jgi:hypothetical protein